VFGFFASGLPIGKRMFEIVDQMIKVFQRVSCVLLGVFDVFDGVSQVIAGVFIVENGVFDFCAGLGFAGEEGFKFFCSW
jgi:hypothetical protein